MAIRPIRTKAVTIQVVAISPSIRRLRPALVQADDPLHALEERGLVAEDGLEVFAALRLALDADHPRGGVAHPAVLGLDPLERGDDGPARPRPRPRSRPVVPRPVAEGNVAGRPGGEDPFQVVAPRAPLRSGLRELEGQRLLRQALAVHPLSPRHVDQRRIGERPHERRQDDPLV